MAWGDTDFKEMSNRLLLWPIVDPLVYSVYKFNVSDMSSFKIYML